MALVRCPICLLLFLPGAARRSIHIVNSLEDRQQQTHQHTEALEVSSQALETLLPRAFGTAPLARRGPLRAGKKGPTAHQKSTYGRDSRSRLGLAWSSTSSPRARAPRMVAPVTADYAVVGAGASGMAFVDSLLKHSPDPVSVLLLDRREQPGGHWNDAYSYVTLHQPARNYGVESSRLEAQTEHPELLASKDEVLAYYRSVLEGWRAAGHQVDFIGDATFDFDASTFKTSNGSVTAVKVGKVVDARFTENDLPVLVPPKFQINLGAEVIPPNELPSRGPDANGAYCVLGAGKTGQDAMLYLREQLNIPAERIAWVMPTDPWITARDPPSPLRQNTCMEFIASALEAHAAAGAPADAVDTADFLQRGFEQLEKEGKVYRIDPAVTPTKFMDATLSRREVEVLRGCAASILRGGRVAALSPTELIFADGKAVQLPWAGDGVQTTFVHCTAGAFNFGASAVEARRAVFGSDRITVQEIFQFPGFCFNAAVIAWLECQRGLSEEQKNELCELPPEGPPAPPLGKVGGNLGPLEAGHPLAVSLRNLRRWYGTERMGEWLHSLRLFSLCMNAYTLEEGKALAEKNYDGLAALGVMKK